MNTTIIKNALSAYLSNCANDDQSKVIGMLCELAALNEATTNNDLWKGDAYLLNASSWLDLVNHTCYNVVGKCLRNKETSMEHLIDAVRMEIPAFDEVPKDTLAAGIGCIVDLWHDNEDNHCNAHDGSFDETACDTWVNDVLEDIINGCCLSYDGYDLEWTEEGYTIARHDDKSSMVFFRSAREAAKFYKLVVVDKLVEFTTDPEKAKHDLFIANCVERLDDAHSIYDVGVSVWKDANNYKVYPDAINSDICLVFSDATEAVETWLSIKNHKLSSNIPDNYLVSPEDIRKICHRYGWNEDGIKFFQRMLDDEHAMTMDEFIRALDDNM